MKQNKILWLIILAIVVSLGLIANIFLSEGEVEKPKPIERVQLVDFRGADIREEKDGKEIWAMSAEEIKYNPKTKDIYLTNLHAKFYEKDTVLEIDAKEGKITDNQQKLHLEGKIHGATKDIIIDAESLDYDAKTGMLSTDKPFYYKNGNTVITADSMKGNRILDKISAAGHVKLRKE